MQNLFGSEAKQPAKTPAPKPNLQGSVTPWAWLKHATLGELEAHAEYLQSALQVWLKPEQAETGRQEYFVIYFTDALHRVSGEIKNRSDES